MTAIDLPLFSYDVVMCDPPWPFQLYSEKGIAKSPEAHYQTMTFDEIEALRVGDLLAPYGVLFLWCTWPLIERQAAVMRAWGVEPKTGGVWTKRTVTGKLRWGTGYIVRSVCEPWLIGTLRNARVRGSSIPNLFETLEDATIDGLAREHSRKPEESYALLEALSPGARRADIFARQRRPGWDGWGNELDKFNDTAEGGDARSEEPHEGGGFGLPADARGLAAGGV